MKSNKSKGLPVADGEFRLLAEEQLVERSSSVEFPRNEEETQRLVHELEVHQIELEMQSEELRRAQEKLELSRDKYSELYDFAPVGYFTFDARGLIQEINLAGAQLLGIERGLLTNIPISRFIADAKGKKAFSSHLKNVLQKKGIQGCEIKLTQKNGQAIYAQVQSTALETNESQGRDILSSIVDVTVAKELESEIQDAREYAENIVETLRAPLVVLDSNLQILTANHCFYETFKVTPEETVGNFIYDVGNRQWDIPQLRVLVEEILPRNTVIKDYEVEHDFPGIGRKIILLSARQIFREKIGSDIILLAMEDITDRKQLETEIQDAREYAENIVETLREPLVVLNFDLKILTANHSFYETFKVTPEETIGNFIYDVGNRQWDIPQLRLLVEEILPLDTVINGYEVEHDFPGIGHKFILLNARQIFREKIGSDIILLAMEDITERKQAESALIQAGALQSAIFNSANFSSIATDAEGVIQIFNVGAERMLGYTAAEVVNKNTPADISDPQEVIARAKSLSTELKTTITPGFDALVFKARRGIEDIYELTYIRKDGSRFPAVVSVTALRDDQETIIGYLLIGTDNTARKKAEEALLQAGALQSAIFHSANFSSIATDEKGVIQIFNVGAERMLGYTAAEVLNKITPADISDPQEVIARAKALSIELETKITPGFDALVFKARRGIEDIYELTYIRKDGSRFPAVVSVTALRDDQETIIGYLLIGTDNTARKKAEEALLQAGALQSAIFNSANFSSIATDEKGVIQIFNVGAERMLGYTAAEVMNQITPADISDPQEIIARAKALSTELKTTITPGFDALVFKARRGIEDIYELTYIRKDGSRFPAVVSVTALRDDQETIIGYLLIGTDNTARKIAEEALLQAGALQRAIFNSANFSSIATDAKGVIQIFNVGAERMLGYTAAEVMNKITPADISDPQEVIARAKALSIELDTKITPGFGALVFKARRGIEDIYELTYIRKDGSRFPAVVSVTALRDDQKTIIGYLLIGTDNTARKQIEEEQKELSQRLQDQQFYTRNLIESNIDPITTTDPSGIITDVNKQMEALTGRTRDELIGTPFKNYFTDSALAEAGIKRVLKEKNISNYELTARARDGKETVVSFNANTFYDRDSKLQGIFYGARDVTERKRLDRALQEKNVELESARSVAEKANLAKSDFLSSMSHELRTPLGAILGFAQLMESGKPEPTAAQKRSIDQILKAGWYLLELINEILDLALIESGKLSLSLEPVSLEEVLHECEVMVEPQAKERGIRVIFSGLKSPYYVNADRTRVKQLLLNLLSNAIKYNKEFGTITVSCTLNHPDFIRISVRDTGAGLTPEQLSQLFQPFNRLGQKGDVEEGTGIGLVVCKRLVELMGGIIGVESTVGEGSVFWFELIRTTEQQSPTRIDQGTAISETTDQKDAQKSTLLYVEDNPANLMLVEDLLARRPDIRFLSAPDAIKGIEIARASLPDVILMDINLPGISGIDALKILADIPETAHIPVVALSANAIPRDIEKGLEAGFFRYLTKPIKVTEFMDTLDMTFKHAKTEAAKAAKKGKPKS
jgi:PAS domain S-box-containing protein